VNLLVQGANAGLWNIEVIRKRPANGTSGCNALHSAAAALAQHKATKSENEDTPTGPMI
jgi:hypothetical protein